MKGQYFDTGSVQEAGDPSPEHEALLKCCVSSSYSTGEKRRWVIRRAVGSRKRLPQEVVSSPSWGIIKKESPERIVGKEIHALGDRLERWHLEEFPLWCSG